MSYSIDRLQLEDGMTALRQFFPDGKADELNFVLFSTSGIHGHYCTIEECEACVMGDSSAEIYDVTFLVVQPRVVAIRYGNCAPRTTEDFAFLKKLRATSHAAISSIGLPAAPTATKGGE